MPRISEYGDPKAVRFEKVIEKELAKFCKKNQKRPSSVIQSAVECFLLNPKCKAKRRL